MEHLFVRLLVVKRYNRNPVIDLISKRVDTVVNNDHVFEFAIADDSQVLHVVAFGGLHAVLAVQPVLEELVVWVDIVQDGVCICLMGRCKHDHLEFFVGLLEALHQVRS